MKHYTIIAVSILSLGLGAGCTGNYLGINSDPYQVTQEQLLADGYAIKAGLTALYSTVVSTDVNTTQFTDCLLGGPMGGYYASTGAWTRTIDTYDPEDGWTKVFMTSSNFIPTLFPTMQSLQNTTDSPIVKGISLTVKVASMHRITDTYGPIPYSQIGVGGQIQVPYDSQQDVYNSMFADLNEAIRLLTENRTGAISSKADNIYKGSPEQWCKFANSLKLRLAMRIVYANPTLAKEMAESAVAHEIGVFSSNTDNAQLTSFGENGNPIRVAVKYNEAPGSSTGGDTHVAADITCYMNGYQDPRREKYFIRSEWENGDYIGQRRGIRNPPLATIGRKYSGVSLNVNSPVQWMNAAEVAFLKAEAAAVFGFSMGGGTAKDFYNQGIRLSFEQWGLSGADAYLANSTYQPQAFVDPAGTNSYPNQLSTVTIAWDDAATTARKQERIIIQKWIANFNLGNEAWADYRRTGYPFLMPVVWNQSSGGIVDVNKGARRMPYPVEEYSNNTQNVNAAVQGNFPQGDNMASRMWWDCNPATE